MNSIPSSTAASSKNTAQRPLAGVRVIDLSSVLMGPLCTQILADYGADVIKVEPPEGDIMRHAGPLKNPQMGPIYLHVNRNKRSIVLDLKQDAARDALLRLCATADLFIHNIRPAVMRRLRLSHEDIQAVKPEIIYISLVGFGQDGPYADKTAVDDVIQAGSGMPSLFQQTLGGEPAYVPGVVADRIVGISAAHAALAALFMRERTGVGQAIEVPMFETMAQLVLGDHMAGKSYDPPVGPMGYSRLLTPNRKPYRTVDGYIGAVVYNNKQWKSFFDAIGQPEVFESDKRFSDAAERAKHYDEVYGVVAEQFATKTTAEWLDLLNAYDIPCMPLHTLESLIEDPHIQAVGLIEDQVHPSEGNIKVMRVPSRWSSADVSLRHHAPRVGEQTREVLLEHGFTDEEATTIQRAGEQPVA